METDRLKYFCTIAETGSLTKAAEILNISHSGLSKSISALESELGFKLFQPQGRGLEITDQGKLAYQKALEVIKAVNDLRMKSLEAPVAKLRVGLSEIIAVSCSSSLGAEFDRPLSFLQLDVGDIEAKILSGELDFGIAFVPSPKPEMEYLKIGTIQFAAYARKDLPAHSSLDIPFIVPATDYPAHAINYRHRDGWPLGLVRNAQHISSHFSISMNLIKGGIGAAYIPSFVAELENAQAPAKLHLKELTQFKEARTERPVFLTKAKSSAESSEMKKMSKVIRQVCCGRF